MLNYQFPDNFNADFKTALIAQFEPIFFAAFSTKNVPSTFKLVIEEPFGEQADAYLTDPSNFGHFLTISWEIDTVEEQVQFNFSELPTTELQQFLQPNTDLPFATNSYQFGFECWHFHDFKDLTFTFSCKRPLSSTEQNTLRFYIYDTTYEYNKVADDYSQVEHVAEKLVGWSNQHYQLSINMGDADAKLIGKMLEAINNIDVAKTLKTVRLV